MIGLELPRVTQRLEAHLPAYLRDLEQLVNIDSGTFDKLGVDRVSQILRARYEAMGAQIEVHSQTGYGDHFTASLKRSGAGRVLLIGHTDTVYATGTTASRPFRIEGTRAYGPGVADMKGGDLCIVYALESLLVLGWNDFGRVTVVHNSDEELGSPSSQDLIRAEASRVDAVLVLESGRENGNIVSARKGIVSGQLRVTGRAAHAGVNHDRGRSAALELAHLVVALEGLNGTVRGATLNVGRIEGGERVNVVPDQAFCRFELRAFERESLHRLMSLVEDVTQRRTVPDTQVELEMQIEHDPMHRSPDSERLVTLAKSLARELGFEVSDTATGGASDGNTAASVGKPVLDGLGPVGGASHSPAEYVDIESIVPRTSLLAGLIASVGTARF